MPSKKKSQGNNKKKKNKGKTGNGNEPFQQRTTTTAGNPPSSRLISGDRPENFQEYEDHRNNSIQQNYGSAYSRYKNATENVIKYLIENTPEYVEGNRNSVDFLLIATDWMMDSRFEIHQHVIRDLKVAIRVRSRVAKSIFGGGDEGHKYFLDILVYCWCQLVSLPRWSNTQENEEKESSQNKNRFEAFLYDDDDDERNDLDEDIFPSRPVPRPEPKQERLLTIDELMGSEDRHDSILFLTTLDDFMGFISTQYRCLAHTFTKHKCPSIVEDLLECAVSVNMTIQQVQVLEIEFLQEYEHINTPCRMIATITLPEITKQISQIVQRHGKTPKKVEQEVNIFLGDCLECIFRCDVAKTDTILLQFCEKLDINTVAMEEIKPYISSLERLTLNEVPINKEKQTVNRLRSLCGNRLQPSYTWLSNFDFIGKDRAIHHTLRLLEIYGNQMQISPNNHVITKPGFFGPSPWQSRATHKIHGDLDEYLMVNILPAWTKMCREGIIGTSKIPYESELCPLFVLFRQWVKNPEQPVSWTLAFAIHAILIATLETASVFDDLAIMSKTLFHHFFSQLEHSIKVIKNEKETKQYKSWSQNIVTVSFLQNLGTNDLGRYALWNPVCGGTIFSTLCYFGNVEAGCTLIDCRYQLGITLHLFHALKVNGILNEGDIPLLDTLYKCFESSRGIWEGSLPVRGEFVKRFCLYSGMSVSDSKVLSDSAKQAILSHTLNEVIMKIPLNQRKRNIIEPAEISVSYRRICNRDFQDTVDIYHTDEQRARMKDTDAYALAVRSNDTMDAIAKENQFLAFNFPALGNLIEQFVCSLGRILQWSPILSASASIINEDTRQSYIKIFAQQVLGAMDFADDPHTYEFMEGFPIGLTCEKFMRLYFNELPPSNLVWFQPTESDNARVEVFNMGNNGYRKSSYR